MHTQLRFCLICLLFLDSSLKIEILGIVEAEFLRHSCHPTISVKALKGIHAILCRVVYTAAILSVQGIHLVLMNYPSGQFIQFLVINSV